MRTPPKRSGSQSYQGRELASREQADLRVVLLWHPRDDALTVRVDDPRGGASFELAVARDRGLEAFYHPFAYATGRGLSFAAAAREPIDLHSQN